MKKIIINILKGIWILLGIVALYVLCVLLIPYIKVPENKGSQPKTITAYILTNGVHTDIVMPIKSKEIDWSKKIKFGNTRSGSSDYNYVSIGWGDKGFYLDTPTWAELKFSTAVKAAFWLGESAMHCTFYKSIQESKNCKKIELSREQYVKLIDFVQKKFDYNSSGETISIKTDAVYGKNDAFYEAQGSYNFLNTCNTWANNGLKHAGQKAALWTATDFGIFQHYK